MLLRTSTVLAAVALLAGCSSSSGSGAGGSCPCTVGNSGLHFTIACGHKSCVTINGQTQGYDCESDGAHNDPSACNGSGGADGGGSCSQACDVSQPACGSSQNACHEACATCSGGGLCNVQNACIKPAVQSVAIFGDYAGGTFSIDVDQHVPGLAIGLMSYQPMHVTVTGAYASDVVAVLHDGYEPGTTVSGVSAADFADGQLMAPPSDAGAPSSLVCDTGNGGCGPPSAVEALFTDRLGGSVLLHRCQSIAYTGTLSVSAGGSCP